MPTLRDFKTNPNEGALERLRRLYLRGQQEELGFRTNQRQEQSAQSAAIPVPRGAAPHSGMLTERDHIDSLNDEGQLAQVSGELAGRPVRVQAQYPRGGVGGGVSPLPGLREAARPSSYDEQEDPEARYDRSQGAYWHGRQQNLENQLKAGQVRSQQLDLARPTVEDARLRDPEYRFEEGLRRGKIASRAESEMELDPLAQKVQDVSFERQSKLADVKGRAGTYDDLIRAEAGERAARIRADASRDVAGTNAGARRDVGQMSSDSRLQTGALGALRSMASGEQALSQPGTPRPYGAQLDQRLAGIPQPGAQAVGPAGLAQDAESLLREFPGQTADQILHLIRTGGTQLDPQFFDERAFGQLHQELSRRQSQVGPPR